jgi:hypothetical protein
VCTRTIVVDLDVNLLELAAEQGRPAPERLEASRAELDFYDAVCAGNLDHAEAVHDDIMAMLESWADPAN